MLIIERGSDGICPGCKKRFSNSHHPKPPDQKPCQVLTDRDEHCSENSTHLTHKCGGQVLVYERRSGNDRRQKIWTI